MKTSAPGSPMHRGLLKDSLLMTVMLALAMRPSSALWMPDDAAVVTLAPASGGAGTTPLLVPPTEQRTAAMNLSKSDIEGSGERDEVQEEQREDYTDEERWAEEGQGQLPSELEMDLAEFGEETAPHAEHGEDIWNSRVEVQESGVPDLRENIETEDDDMYFEEDLRDVSDERADVTSPVPGSDFLNFVRTESNESNLDEKSERHQHVEIESPPVNHSQFVTALRLSTITSITAARGNYLTSASTSRESFPLPTSDGSYLEKAPSYKSNFAAVSFRATDSDADASAHAGVDATDHEEEDDGNPGVGSDAVLLPPTSKSPTESATVATTPRTDAVTAAASVTAPTGTASEPDTFSVANSDSENGFNVGSDSATDSNVDSYTASHSESPGIASPTPSPALPPSPSALPSCLQDCRARLNSLQLAVTPAHISAPRGTDVSILARLTDPEGGDPQVKLDWRFQSDNGSQQCSLGPLEVEGDVENCTETKAQVEVEFSNQTASVIRLAIPETTPSDSGKYSCVVTVRCCEGTAHAQTISRSETSVIKIYTKPMYGAQLAAVSVVCLCLLTGILGSACLQRRRRRKKRVSGPDHVHYEPVRLLQLPHLEGRRAGDDIDDDFDDFDEGDDAVPSDVGIGTVRVNPMSEVPLTPLGVIPQPPELTSLARESQFEFPRPPSDLLKRMSSNMGFD